MKLYEKLDNSTSHKKIIELLAEHFQRLEPAEVKITAYLALGTIGPRFEKIDLGIGDKYGIQAISQAYDVDMEKVEIAFENQGDLGDVASDLNDRQRSSLTLKYVFQHFVQIRDVSGKGSQKRKINLLAEVLSQARPLESRYIMRIARGNLRLGFGEKFLLEALALAFTGSRNNTAKVEDTYNICTDIGQLGESLAKHGMSSLGKFSIKIGRPVQMMLASRVDTMEGLNEKFSATMAAEEKYDGERVQVHVDGDNIKAFSRRLTDISAQFPDVIEAVRESVKAEKVVLDGEIVAYRQGEFLPFQELMQRRRKYHVKEYVEKIPVAVFFSLMLYISMVNP